MGRHPSWSNDDDEKVTAGKPAKGDQEERTRFHDDGENVQGQDSKKNKY